MNQLGDVGKDLWCELLNENQLTTKGDGKSNQVCVMTDPREN